MQLLWSFLTLCLPLKPPKPPQWFVFTLLFLQITFSRLNELLHHLLRFVGMAVSVCWLLTSPWWVLVCWWRTWSCSGPPGASSPRCWPHQWRRWCHPGPNCRPLPCCLELSVEEANRAGHTLTTDTDSSGNTQAVTPLCRRAHVVDWGRGVIMSAGFIIQSG